MKRLLALALLSCSPPPECETACGLVLPEERCAELRAEESRTLYAIADAPLLDYSPSELCAAFGRYEVVEDATVRGWALRDGDYRIRLHPAAYASSLGHELAHIADDLRGHSGHKSAVWAVMDPAATTACAARRTAP